MNILIVSQDTPWTKKLMEGLLLPNTTFHWSKSAEIKAIDRYHPDWVFFFHWSQIVPPAIYEEHRCAVIHTGNLPLDRGGSPLQNQIIAGTYQTQINILEMTDILDGGSVYASAPISLQGSLMDIWLAISKVSADLIINCITTNPTPTPQGICPKVHKRIKDNHINLDSSKGLWYIYDQIRMVDAEGYPDAHLSIDGFRLDFTRAKLTGDSIISDVRITKE